MPESLKTSTLTPAMNAFAKELPYGQRRTELLALIHSFETTDNDGRSIGWGASQASAFRNTSGLTSLSSWMERVFQESRVRSRRRMTMAYPLVVLGLAFAVFAFLGRIAITPFTELVRSFGVRIPTPTALLFDWNERVQMNFFTVVFVVIIVVGTLYAIVRFAGRRAIGSKYFGWLFRGDTASVSSMASFVGLLFDLLTNGTSLPDSLDLAGQGCGNEYYSMHARQLAVHLREQRGALSQCSASHAFPRNLIDALEPCGERPINLHFLHELSKIYGSRAVTRTQRDGSALGIFALFIVGCIVLFIVVSLFMPLVGLISGLA